MTDSDRPDSGTPPPTQIDRGAPPTTLDGSGAGERDIYGEAHGQTLAKGIVAADDENPRRAGRLSALAGPRGTEDSLGRATALAVLRPLAVKLDDQREREEVAARQQRAEEEAAERERTERENRISSGRATPADLDEVAREALSQISSHDPTTVAQVWKRLVVSHVVGPATYDLVEVEVHAKRWPLLGRPLGVPSEADLADLDWLPGWLAPSISLMEVSRSTVWFVPNTDTAETDTWLDVDGTVWVPTLPDKKGNGFISPGVERLWIAVPRDTALHLQRRTYYTGPTLNSGGRRWRYPGLVEGTAVTSSPSTDSEGIGAGDGLYEAVVTLLRSRLS